MRVPYIRTTVLRSSLRPIPSPHASTTARGSWRAPSLRGHRCCAPSATSHRTRENIYRCSRYMASGNKSTVFIFKWRVFNFCLVVSKEKGNMQRHPDSSGLESGGASSWLVNNTPRVQGCLEPSPLESRSGLGSSRLVNNTKCGVERRRSLSRYAGSLLCTAPSLSSALPWHSFPRLAGALFRATPVLASSIRLHFLPH